MSIVRLFSRRGLASLAASCLVAAGAVGVLSLSAASASTPSATAAPGVGIEVAPGSGILYYDWGCDRSYSSTSITFNTNGTFTTGEGSSGTWVRIGGTAAGMITFQFTNSRTTYSSVTTSAAATGIQSTFGGTNGCHHISGSGTTTQQQLNDDTHAADGTRIKR